MIRTIYFILLGLLIFNLGFSQSIQKHSGCLTTSLNSLNTLTTTLPAVDGGANYLIEKARAVVYIDFGDDYPFGDQAFSAGVSLNFNVVDGNNSWSGANFQPLFNPAGQVQLTDVNPEKILFVELPFTNNSPGTPAVSPYTGNANTFSITLTPSLTGGGTTLQTPSGATTITNAIRIRVCYEIDYRVDVRSANNLNSNVSVVASTPILNSKQYELKWNTSGVDYPAYEVQILKLEHTSPVEPLNKYYVESTLDWNQALSFELEHGKVVMQGNDLTYTLSMAQGAGYYVWRVRPVGNYYKNNFGNNQNWGIWSATVIQPANQFITVTDPNDLQIYNDAFYFDDPDEDINYSYSRSFTNQGHTHEGISYADGLMRTQQSQSYLPSHDKTIVTQTVYDQQGRAVISLLPVPTDGKIYEYKDNFVQDLNGDPYTIDNFDVDAKMDAPDPIKLNGTAYSYYSDLSSDDYVPSSQKDPTDPNAGGFPFARTQLSEDGLAYVRKQTGVGPMHMLGEGNKITKKYYGKATDHELIRIFGEEAPRADAVLKEYTKDPNGITSIAYINIKSGKVIATCLAINDQDGDGDLSTTDGQESLEGLASETEQSTTFEVEDFLTNNTYTEEGFETSSRLYLVEKTDVTLSYLPECNQPSICGTNISTQFEVYFYLYNVEDYEQTNNLIPTAFQVQDVTNLCNNGGTALTVTIASLPEGEYVFKKILKPVGDNLEQQIETVVDNFESAILPMTRLVGVLLQSIEGSQDWATFLACESCFNTHWNGASQNSIGLISCLRGVFQNAAQSNPSMDLVVTELDNFDPALASPSMPITASEGMITAVNFNNNPADISIVYNYSDCGKSGDLSFPMNEDVSFHYCPNSNNKFDYPGAPAQGYDYPPFLEYFAEEVGELFLDIHYGNNGMTANNQIFSELFPGYNISHSMVGNYITNGTSLNENDFNKMIWHMMFDEYACGQVRRLVGAGTLNLQIFDESIGTYTTFDATNLDHISTQYDCSQLWDCWIATVQSYAPLLEAYDLANFSTTPTNYSNLIDDQNEGDGSVHDNAVLDNIPWILRIFIGRNNLIDNLTNPNASGYMGPELSAADLEVKSLPALFLNCTGYRFAAFIDPTILTYPLTSYTAAVNDCNNYLATTHNNAGYSASPIHNLDIPLAGSYSGGAVPPYFASQSIANEAEDYFYSRNLIGNVPTPLDVEHMPRIFNPIYGFKYYEHEGGSTTKTGDLLACEMQYCFEGQNYETYCGGKDCSVGHEEWTCGRRYEFYQCIINTTLIEPPLNGSNEVIGEQGGEPIDCETVASTYTSPETVQDGLAAPDLIGNPLVKTCFKACEARRSEVRAMVIKLLEDRCYTVGGCSESAANVSFEELEGIVQMLIEECGTNCEADVSFYNENCDLLLADGTDVNISYCNIENGTACQQYIIEQVKYWDMEIDLAPAPDSDCDPSNHLIPAFNAGVSSENPASNCDGTAPLSDQDYSPIKKLNAIELPSGQ